MPSASERHPAPESMDAPSRRNTPGRWGAALAGIWGFVAVLDASQAYVVKTADGLDPSWIDCFAWTLPTWAVWALLTPVVFAATRRFRIEPAVWERSLVVHLLLAGALAVVHHGLYTLLVLAPGEATILRDAVASLFGGRFQTNLLVYCAVVGLFHAFDYHRRYRARELEAARLEAHTSQLEAQLAQAHLRALKMQLHPHFLFNTLNAIAALVRAQDSTGAVRMLARLSDLLRMTLDHGGRQEVSLREELAFLERYLEIEQIRFQDRLTVQLRVDPKALGALVPNMILQPLAENAIRHGIARDPKAGRVEVTAERRGALLYLSVRDDGPGLSSTPQPGGSGIGLANTRARLHQAYGSQHRFDLADAPEGGAVAHIVIPYRSVAKPSVFPVKMAPDATSLAGAAVDAAHTRPVPTGPPPPGAG